MRVSIATSNLAVSYTGKNICHTKIQDISGNGNENTGRNETGGAEPARPGESFLVAPQPPGSCCSHYSAASEVRSPPNCGQGDVSLTRGGGGHMVLRKDEVEIGNSGSKGNRMQDRSFGQWHSCVVSSLVRLL